MYSIYVRTENGDIWVDSRRSEADAQARIETLRAEFPGCIFFYVAEAVMEIKHESVLW